MCPGYEPPHSFAEYYGVPPELKGTIDVEQMGIPYFYYFNEEDKRFYWTPPSPVQEKFHNSNAKIRLYSGAFAAGKTTAGCQEVFQLCLQKHPGIIGAVCRLTSGELRETTQRRFFEVLAVYEDALQYTLGDPAKGMSDGIPGYSAWQNTFHFLPELGGSLIYFKHLDDWQKLGSLELGFFYFDEGAELNEDVYRMMIGRLRQNNVRWRGGFVTTNPADFGNWVYLHVVKKQSRNVAVWHTSTYDNKYLADDYLEGMIENYDEDYKRRYLLGEWGTFEGLVYKGFKPQKMVQNFNVPLLLKRDKPYVYGGQDYGLESPMVHLTVAYDGERLFVLDEFYAPGLTSDEFIEEVRVRQKKYDHQKIFGDPSDGDIIKRQRQKGLPVRKANNAVEEGIRRVKNFVRMRGSVPMIVIHKDNCPNLANEFMTYKYAKSGGTILKDRPEKKNDHCFVGETLVETVDGGKRIDEVVAGDRVLTRKGYRKVLMAGPTQRVIELYKLVFTGGQDLVGTGDHKIWIKDKDFTPMKEIATGDYVLDYRGYWVGVKEIKKLFRRKHLHRYNDETGPSVQVYNLHVEDQHEYYANGILVSNCLDALRYIVMGITGSGVWIGK